MSMPIEYASFLIRLWRETNLDPRALPAEWRGEAEHIQTGEGWTFDTLDELLGFLRRQAKDWRRQGNRTNESAHVSPCEDVPGTL